MADQGREIVGGFVLLSSMPEARLNPFERRVYSIILNSGFNVKSPLVKNEDRNLQDTIHAIIQAVQEVPDSIDTYCTLHHLLNWIELTQLLISSEDSTCICTLDEIDGTNRDVYQVQVNEKFFEMCELQSAGLIKLRECGSNGKFIRGQIIQVFAVDFTLHFVINNDMFSKLRTDNTKYEVSFEPSTFTIRAREHMLNILRYGVSTGSEYMIFPKETLEDDDEEISIDEYMAMKQEDVNRIKFSSLRFNQHQKLAIYTILSGEYNEYSMLPFILHGPPGTGKTTTIVEAIRLLIQNSNNRILVCAPSNNAADVVTLELLNGAKIDPQLIFRMYSLTKLIENKAEDLHSVSCIIIDVDCPNIKSFGIWPIEKLLQFRVVICTLSASAYLINGGMNGKFSHIFVDEAGQATEIDSLIPIVGLRSKETKIILAGDFMQLGPVVLIHFFEKHNLMRSLIERLARRDFFKKNPRLMMMLIENYRSHPDLIKVPSDLFYNGKLISSPDAERKDKLANWDRLPKKDTPMIWHHIAEAEKKWSMIDKDVKGGYSFCNYGEVQQIIEYVKQLTSELLISPKDIGIISPYKLQVFELNRAFKQSFPEITVDTVERFQGSERRVIIISPVRSTDQIGFVKCPKVVGNHLVLAKSPEYKRFITYCYEKGATIGVTQNKETNVAENGNEETNVAENGKEEANVAENVSEEANVAENAKEETNVTEDGKEETNVAENSKIQHINN